MGKDHGVSMLVSFRLGVDTLTKGKDNQAMTENSKQDLIQALRTEAVEDFLKTVYKLQRKSDPVPTTLLATELGIKPPSVTEMAKKLADNGLLEYEKYRGLRLTEAGRQIALEVIRHHRLLEMYLTEALGYSWDQVHDEADRLEHVISEQFEARIAAALGDPSQDPHGDPIPALDGSLPPSQEFRSLADLELDQPAIVCRITNQVPDVLRYLAERGLVLGAQVEVTAREPFNGPLQLLVEDSTAVVSHDIAADILLTPRRKHA
jgi:DtxR family Mn-dependent transcriptional regulator